jgi:MoaA/NifB/PqqE/SkfB family radical SAM enzyme
MEIVATAIKENPVEVTMQQVITGKKIKAPTITGFRQRIIRALIWMNVFWLALVHSKNPIAGLKKLRVMRKQRTQYHPKLLIKYAHSGNRYFANYVTPGWPSLAFNRYVTHLLKRFSGEAGTISTIIFGVTKKCGFQCEHCSEWLNLNKPETLSREDLLLIVHRFHELGIGQVQLSGGEPLNRLNDIYYLLENAPKGIDFWLYSTGYSLTPAKAMQLKKAGLTGIAISMDHFEREKHNEFRGVKDAWEKALQAARVARDADLLVCFSLCATNEFISESNLLCYAELARESGVSFIQLLEPKAVGHYTGKDVSLRKESIEILESFFEKFNYDPAFSDYPSVVYHGYYSRRKGCSGAGQDYVYVDTDGDIHNCPFCQRKLFSAFDDDLKGLVNAMKGGGCQTFRVSKPS